MCTLQCTRNYSKITRPIRGIVSNTQEDKLMHFTSLNFHLRYIKTKLPRIGENNIYKRLYIGT